jgi:hypothetical protein
MDFRSYRPPAECSFVVSEEEMINPDAVPADFVPFTMPQNAVEALKRLRSSYKTRPVTGADWAVLFAVESTLKNPRNPPDAV